MRGADKVAHVGLYTVLGASLAYGRLRALAPPPHFLMLLVGIGYGATDEWHQSFVVWRTPDLGDWLADVVGVLTGYGVTTVLARLRARGTTEPTD